MSAGPPPRDSTLCARGEDDPSSVSRPLAPSLHLSSVYRIADLDQIDGLYDGRFEGFFYARDGHPNAVELAAKLARLEGAEAGLVCASGMAAIAATLLATVSQGEHVVISEGLYGKTTTLVARELLRFGVSHDSFDPAAPESLAKVLTSQNPPGPRRDHLQSLAPCRRPRGDRPSGPRGERSPAGRPFLRPAPLPADRAGGDSRDALGHQADRRPQRRHARGRRGPAGPYRQDQGRRVGLRPDRKPVR